MIVLKIIGWVLLGLIALIVLALCVKVRIAVEYSDDNTSAVLQWLFLKIPLYPSKKKDKPEDGKDEKDDKKDEKDDKKEEDKEEEKPSEEEADAEPEDGENPTEEKPETKPAKKKESLLHLLYRSHGVDGILLIVKRVFSYLGSFVGDLMKSLVIEEAYLDIGCTRSDAASTAIYYGEVCSALFPMLGALVTKYKVRKYDINIYPDFIARFSSASFFVKLYLRPIYVIAIALLLVFRLIFKVALSVLVKIIRAGKEKAPVNQNKKITEKRDDS